MNEEKLIELAKEVLKVVDYDIYKEVLNELEDDPESYTLLDEIAEVLTQYIEVEED